MLKTLKIQGMSCGHCENRVKNALAELGITVVEVSAKEDMAKVEINDESMIDEIVDAIEDAGYDVISVL